MTAIGCKPYICYSVDVPSQCKKLFAAQCVRYDYFSIQTRTGNLAAIRAETNACYSVRVTIKCVKLIIVDEIPNPYQGILISNSQKRTIWAKLNAGDSL